MLTGHYTWEVRHKEMNEACQCACPVGIARLKLARSDTGADVLILLSARSQTLLSRHLSAGGYANVGSRSRFARPHRSGQGSNYDEVTSPRESCPSVTAKSTSWESVKWAGCQLRAVELFKVMTRVPSAGQGINM